ncbi:uncharacterized protein B0H18DRAFT_968792 [Fomitopsis serialis]|uniref:uncharacterized protein n=1 Tax=Fomitopsis serialis TaxID=139415 RepID=UPI002008B98B|nr:uncharacterized protein B0H18DRAFT_968792 [Neoantrodia serialis]KAH9937021.1 hypothetical protein B0H18DRAFT_968792 [Neoantrodia serialis]
MGLYLLDYGAGNVQSLANTLTKLGYEFKWIASPDDFDKATSLIFPGVGAFGSAIDGLNSRGYTEPLRRYIASDDLLFQASAESPSHTGLGVSVPHMGWNSIEFLDPEHKANEGLDESLHYYYSAQWIHSTTSTGRKSSCDRWLSQPQSAAPPSLPLLPSPAPKPQDGLTKRIVACMDVRSNDDGDLVVTKGDQYDVREKAPSTSDGTVTGGLATSTAGAVRNLGKPVALAERYFSAGADELCLMNITSFRHSPLLDQPMLAVVRAAAEEVFVPLTIGGGIKDTVDPDGTPHSALEVAGAYFRAGADKVSVATEAVYAVERMRERARWSYVDPGYDGPYKDELVFGKPDGAEKERGKAWWYQCTVKGGRENRPLSVVQLAKGVEKLGAGEIILNSIDRDGTGLGFDVDLIALVRKSVRIPVVASSGAGKPGHFVEVFEKTGVEAALAAGIFHREEVRIQDVKQALSISRFSVRT